MPRQRIWMLLWLGGAIGALLLLASSLASLAFQPGHVYSLGGRLIAVGPPGATLTLDPATLAFWQALVTAVSLALLLYLAVALILSAELRRELLRRVASVLTVMLMIYLALGLLQRLPIPGDAAQPSALPTAPRATAEPFPTFVSNPAPWLTLAIGALLAALLLGAMVFVWRRSRAPRAPLAQLAGEAQAALASLQSGGDLKDTVLRCYREMSRILSAQPGVERTRDMTAREFELRLAAAGLRDEHIQQLSRLFERVRYGARRADAAEERAAIDCLAAIARSYGRAP